MHGARGASEHNRRARCARSAQGNQLATQSSSGLVHRVRHVGTAPATPSSSSKGVIAATAQQTGRQISKCGSSRWRCPVAASRGVSHRSLRRQRSGGCWRRWAGAGRCRPHRPWPLPGNLPAPGCTPAASASRPCGGTPAPPQAGRPDLRACTQDAVGCPAALRLIQPASPANLRAVVVQDGSTNPSAGPMRPHWSF